MLTATAPGLAQILMRRAHDVEGAEQIDIDDGLERIRRHAEHGGGKITGGPGNQHIDFAELGMRIGQRRRNGRGIAHIGGAAHRLAAQPRQFRDRRLNFVFGAADHRHFGSVRSKAARDAEIDAAGAAGNKNRTACKIERIHVSTPHFFNRRVDAKT